MLIHSKPAVLAVITHYRYEQWLAQSIESLLRQTRPPAAIVVLDDASPVPPVDIVRRYPGVSLLVASHNSGSYAMLQAVFDATDFDSYMLQDADDWSSDDRLAVLLDAEQRSGADMVGCQVTTLYDGLPPEPEILYPEDARGAVLANPTFHPILMATSVIRRSLIQRVGGLSTGLRFGADSEFIRRAIFAGRVINVPQRCYFRRVHAAAITRTPATGYASPARRQLQPLLQARARDNVARFLRGEEPDLTPYRKGESAVLSHVAGPPLRGFPA